MADGDAFSIEAAGTALALAVGDGVPVVTHFGRAGSHAAALAATARPAISHSSFDVPRAVSALPSQLDGWSGTPALELRRGRRAVLPRLALVGLRRDGQAVEFDLRDDAAGVRVTLRYRIEPGGAIRAAVEVENATDDPLDVDAARLLLPLPTTAAELLDTTGRWSGERRPQRGPVLDGTHRRAARRGRTGHDAAGALLVGTPGFAFRRGEVWATHVAWSGDAESLVERLSDGVGVQSALLGGGEHLVPGEVRLGHGERYASPEVLFAWSDGGIDGISARFHAVARALPAHPGTPRPVTLNTWEAVYFDHDLGRLTELARAAAGVGVERFVLDDGWFQGRRGDTAGLGDWTVDPAVWPQGLEPLARAVQGLGMEFGLWFEPEMVNSDSDLARQHPEWLLAEPAVGPSWRHQFALNLAHPEAWASLFDRMSALIGALDVRFVKWDHNRDLHEAVDRRTGLPGVHEQTLAAYRLMDALREAHPRLEIESCASGGARADLGVMAHAQRVWASDTNDAIERQSIQRWMSVLLPPEVLGSHVGPARSHTTGREIDLSFRLVTALLAHAGIEWDITTCTPAELAALTAWSARYKANRALIATGTSVRADDAPEGSHLSGLVSPKRDRALFAWVQTEVGPLATTPRTRLPGLDRDRRYRVRLDESLGQAGRRSQSDPTWILEGIDEFDGALLTDAGLPLPALHPAQGLLLEVVAL